VNTNSTAYYAALQGTMKAIIKRAAKEVYEQELEQFVFGHPAQVALLGLQFDWTATTQESALALPLLASLKMLYALLLQLVTAAALAASQNSKPSMWVCVQSPVY
jgi:hypothetical protein